MREELLKMLLSLMLYASAPSSNPFQDAGWVGVVVAILVGIATIATTVIITIWTVRKQRSQKEITYQVISDVPIANINNEVKDRVKIIFDGDPVDDMNILVLKIWNSGNVAVKSDDFFEPITFECEGRKIVGGDVINMEPDNLIAPKDVKRLLIFGLHTISLEKLLLNPKETISIKVLLTGSQGKVKSRVRIADGKMIEFDPTKYLPRSNRLIIIPFLLLISAFISFLVFYLFNTLFLLEILIIALVILSITWFVSTFDDWLRDRLHP